MGADIDVEHFARLADALHPWLDEVVIVGGWAHRLYRLHLLARSLDYEPLGTFDTDIAVPGNLATAGHEMRHRLLENGFREELPGYTQPPVAHYYATTNNSGFYAEFLTPLIGGDVKRGDKRDATTRIAGVPVQKLRHQELLLEAPWDVTIGLGNGYPTVESPTGACPERSSLPGAEDPHS